MNARRSSHSGFLETPTMSAHIEGGATVMDTMWTRGCREQSARIYIIGPYELGFRC